MSKNSNSAPNVYLFQRSDFLKLVERLEREAHLGSPQYSLFSRAIDILHMKGNPQQSSTETKDGFANGLRYLLQRVKEDSQKKSCGTCGVMESICECECAPRDRGVLTPGDVLCVLGTLLEEGIGVYKDHATAFRYYMRATRRGHPEGCCIVGWFFDRGLVVPCNFQKAFEYYTTASAKVL